MSDVIGIGAATCPPPTVPADEPARLTTLRRYEVLDTPRDGAFTRAAQVAAHVFDVPMATVTLVDEDRIWFKAAEGLPLGVAEISREPGLCASAILQDEPYVLPDTLRDPRTLENSLVRGRLGVRFYAGAPIVTEGGHRLGTVNVLDTRPRQPTSEQLCTLRSLAGMVMQQLDLRLAALRAARNQEMNLRNALASRTDTDRAVGMVMQHRQCTAEEAWQVLTLCSQGSNIKVRRIAEAMAELVASTTPALLEPAAYRAARRVLQLTDR
ncbi:GAF and ANTAR domain-containing protein [Rhodococcus sp. X156]|uniref:GAF and ANTAR domain-containing protein n=1 Tax=Rhodococcus sp. X156 TaxID=2499145 RepID=UPI000FDA63A5|nr:GAF and ANTAR domain-containing protein [Rhodococcus sp. X156]